MAQGKIRMKDVDLGMLLGFVVRLSGRVSLVVHACDGRGLLMLLRDESEGLLACLRL